MDSNFSRGCVLIVLLLFLQGGCSTHLSLQPPPPGKKLDYCEVLNKWTRHATLYSTFETVAKVHVTLFSPEFLEAQIQEYQRVYDPPKEELRKVAAKLHNLENGKTCVFLSLLTEDPKLSSLLGERPFWRVYFKTSSGLHLNASSISEVPYDDPVYQHFFPYMSKFYQSYEVCFPQDLRSLQGKVRWIKILLRSPAGKVDLEWKLE